MLSRRHFSQRFSYGLIGFPFIRSWGLSPLQDSYLALIQKAGNAQTERVRFLFLEKALELPGLTSEVQANLREVVTLVDSWANGKKNYESRPGEGSRAARYLHNFFNWTIDLNTWVMPKVSEEDPLFPLVAWYRGRMLIQMVIQHGSLQSNPTKRTAYFEEAQRLLRIAHEAFPQNERMGMYLGEPIPWRAEHKFDPSAPEWANIQRETLEKLTEILHWWIDERQLLDGQYGGGWGDDVEMWRDWLPILVAFKDPKVVAAQERLSSGLFAQPHMKDGYTHIMTDVEHTAEDSADTCTAMMHVDPDNQVWKQRALRLVELMRTQWTGINERGFLQFKSTYFNVSAVDPDPRKACDTVYHPRAIQPALLYWQRTDDESVGRLILRWMDLWVDATTREENGKPAGIIPSAIHWPDGQVGGTTAHWWRPGNHTSDPLYVWPSAMRMMVNTLLLCYYKSGKKTYVQPIDSMARIYRKFLKDGQDSKLLKEGSEAWCASKMDTFLPDVLAKYRKLTGDTQYDDLLEQAGNGFVKWSVTGSTKPLFQQMRINQQSLAHNRSGFMEEVRWTDRVFSFHKSYLNYFIEPPIPVFDSDFLFSTLTGNVGNALYFPTNAVRWQTPSTAIAIWVKEATTTRFMAELYHFGDSKRHMGAEFFLLAEGTYTLVLQEKEPKNISMSKPIQIEKARKKVEFMLEPGKLYVLALSQV